MPLLLSLDKTKLISDLVSSVKDHAALLMLKLDGLMVKLVYEDGNPVEGSTRGDGDEGEFITHNIAAFRNVPLFIPYKKHHQKTDYLICGEKLETNWQKRSSSVLLC